MVNPFTWIRQRMAAAVVEGFTEGLQRIEAGACLDPEAVEALQDRIAAALAAPAAAALAAPAATSNGSTAPSKARGRKGGAK